jgi:hypothetical protein
MFTDTETYNSIFEHIKIAKIERKGRLILSDGKGRAIDKHIISVTTDHLMEHPAIFGLLKEGHKITDIKDHLIEKLQEISRDVKRPSHKGSDWLEVDNYFTVHNAENDEILVFRKKGGKANIDYKAYAKKIGQDPQTVYGEADLAFVEYNPLQTKVIFFRDSKFRDEGQVKVANTYVAPLWQIEPRPENPQMPPLFKKFFEHLFPVEEERLAVFHWIHCGMAGRAQTILCVPGIQGIGKTLLGEGILKAVFGDTNWVKAPRSFVSKEFNSFLEAKRVVLVEEVPTPRSREDRIAVNEMLKDVTNDTVSIEGKGKDARTVDNWANLIVTSNKLRAIPLESPTDRRFMCVSTSRTKLDKVFSNEEYEEFTESLNPDSEEIRAFSHWLMVFGKVPGMTAHYCPQTEIKYQIYRMSLTMWEMKLLKKMEEDRINKNGIFTGEELEAYVKKEKVKLSTIEEFLEVFQLPSGEALGYWDKSGVYCFSKEAMTANLYINPRYIQKNLFGDEDGLADIPEEEDEFYFSKYGMSKSDYEKKMGKPSEISTDSALDEL